jgi:hypothetical protein
MSSALRLEDLDQNRGGPSPKHYSRTFSSLNGKIAAFAVEEMLGISFEL